MRAWVLALAILPACKSNDPVVEVVEGALGHGEFQWECVDDRDITCGTGAFPRAVALGSTFDLSFSVHDRVPNEVEVTRIESVSPHRLGDDGDFLALLPGQAAVVALGPSYAIDFFTLDLLPVTGLSLWMRPEELDCVVVDCSDPGPVEPTAGGPVELARGVSTDVVVVPDSAGIQLGGALNYTWTSATPERLAVTSSSGHGATLRGLAIGTAELVVQTGDHQQTFELTIGVGPDIGPVRRPPGPTRDSAASSDEGGDDSGTDAGTDAGSGSGTAGESTSDGTDTGGST
jgi:hypothetical protein